jgi:hypothetical protein
MITSLMPETASAPKSARQRYAFRATLLMLGFIGLYVSSELPALTGLVLPLRVLAVLCLLGVVYEFAALMRALDELQMRIHLIALAYAGGAVCALMTGWGLIALENDLRTPGAVLALPGMALGYYIALFFVSRRYA